MEKIKKIKFNNANGTFFSAVNAAVDNYFKDRKLKKTGNNKLYLKSAIMVTAGIATYIVLLTVNLNPVIAALLCCLLGFEKAAIGFNVMHDANHGSYSQKKWVNSLLSLSANIMGANSWMWKQKHNIIHHTYTNLDGLDDDIAKSPFLRMCASQKKYMFHRYQYLYAIPVYGLAAILIFLSDFQRYFTGKIVSTKVQKMDTREHFIFWISKAFYVFTYLLLPMWVVGILPAIAGFMLMHLVLGITLSVVFQLAHVVEETHFVDATKKGVISIEDEWAIHQVRTTADFATNNKIISWFMGGLNFQVEHHLFPKISHVHYPAIHKIVKDVCIKHAVRFNNFPSMTSALYSHLSFLKQLGVS